MITATQRLQLQKAAQQVVDSEHFLLGVLAVRARKLAETHPYDQCVLGMSNYLNKRAESQAEITRGELKSVYAKMYTPNSPFAQVFASELGQTAELTGPKYIQHSPQEGQPLVPAVVETNPLLGQLTQAFDHTSSGLTPALGTAACKTVLAELNRQNLPPQKLVAVAGQEDLILCQASYDTPKGVVQVLIPVEMRGTKALLPTIFLSSLGCLDLNAKDLEEHILASAGKSFRVDVAQTLRFLSQVKNGTLRPVSEVEKIVRQASAKREIKPVLDAPLVLIELEPEAPTVPVLELEIPAEIQSVADSLTSAAGQAEFLFGAKSVRTGAALVAQAFQTLGEPRVQLRVASVREEGPVWAVTAGSLAVKVPVKMNKNSVSAPSVCLAGGQIFPLTLKGLAQARQQTPSAPLQAVASAAYDLKPSQLLEQLKVAMIQNNYAQAEDVLNVLEHKGDQRAIVAARAIYRAGLKGELGTISKCAATYRTAASTQDICSHTHLPVNKVYQDEQGQCHPAWRRGTNLQVEGGYFCDHKVFL